MHLIIDGYNVMHALPVEKEWPGRNSRERRGHFLGALRRYVGSRPHMVTVVFDGTKGGDDMGGYEKTGNLEVRYSRRGEEADQVIRRMVEESANPREILLVSSDKGVSGHGRSAGASIAGAHELVRCLSPNPPRTASPAESFERNVKGYEPEEAGRPRRRSRSPLQLW
jgi:hypothetical protein